MNRPCCVNLHACAGACGCVSACAASVCVCTYTYTCIYIFSHYRLINTRCRASVCVCRRACNHAPVNLCEHACGRARACACVCVHFCVRVHLCVRTCEFACVRGCVWVRECMRCAHSRTHTHAHLCMQYINKLNTKNLIERGEGGGEEREGYLHTFAKIHEYMYF